MSIKSILLIICKNIEHTHTHKHTHIYIYIYIYIYNYFQKLKNIFRKKISKSVSEILDSRRNLWQITSCSQLTNITYTGFLSKIVLTFRDKYIFKHYFHVQILFVFLFANLTFLEKKLNKKNNNQFYYQETTKIPDFENKVTYHNSNRRFLN